MYRKGEVSYQPLALPDRVQVPDERATAAVISNFKQVVKEGNLKLHPLVARLVDAEVLRKMGAERMGGDA